MVLAVLIPCGILWHLSPLPHILFLQTGALLLLTDKTLDLLLSHAAVAVDIRSLEAMILYLHCLFHPAADRSGVFICHGLVFQFQNETGAASTQISKRSKIGLESRFK